MNVTCNQDQLKRGLSIVSRVVAAKSPLPVLANILLATDNGRLKLAATDLDIGITTWIPAEIGEEGSITLPARLFGDIVGNLPNHDVNLALDARTQTVKLTCSRFTSNIKGIEADDFPPIPTVDGDDATLKVSAGVLRTCIEQVAFAASTDESRPVLTGVLVRLHPNEASGGYSATFAAADGYRLATRSITLPAESKQPSFDISEFIVPAKALSELGRIIGDAGDDPVVIAVTSGGGQVLFQTEQANLVSRLIDGRFPDFERIIPSAHTTRSIIDTQELVKAVKLASFFATANQNFVKLTIEPGDDINAGKLIISANAAEIGDNTSELDGTITGESNQIAMNVKFLNEALAAMGTPQIALETQNPQSPGVFKPVGDEGYIHVIMPMTLR